MVGLNDTIPDGVSCAIHRGRGGGSGRFRRGSSSPCAPERMSLYPIWAPASSQREPGGCRKEPRETGCRVPYGTVANLVDGRVRKDGWGNLAYDRLARVRKSSHRVICGRENQQTLLPAVSLWEIWRAPTGSTKFTCHHEHSLSISKALPQRRTRKTLPTTLGQPSDTRSTVGQL